MNALDKAVEAFREVEPHAVINRAALFAAIKTERERCAKIAENWLEAFGATNPTYIDQQTWACDAVRDIADLIRQPTIKD